VTQRPPLCHATDFDVGTSRNASEDDSPRRIAVARNVHSLDHQTNTVAKNAMAITSDTMPAIRAVRCAARCASSFRRQAGQTASGGRGPRDISFLPQRRQV
jgi:hypothetical protein